MSSELNELRISAARLESDAKDASITLDTFKDKVSELQNEIEEQRGRVENMKKSQSREKEEEKEKRKQEMLNDMMSKIDMVRPFCDHILPSPPSLLPENVYDGYHSSRPLTRCRVQRSTRPAKSSDKCSKISIKARRIPRPAYLLKLEN